ncbi:globin [Dyella sp. EPa41]|uniref:globin n=1 Tax=Dyella sp. EPa41 TaxID=1561194 RepID=UPI0019164793|nr:globin [Dyella sp. EPa41]
MTDTFDDLQTSYGRCLRQGGFIARFYEIFMASHPDIPGMFRHTDFSAQYSALRRGISAAIAFAGGSTLTRRTMTEMAKVHSRKGRAPVSPTLYPYWSDSLLRAIAEFDPEYDFALEQRWRKALEHTTAYFIEHY